MMASSSSSTISTTNKTKTNSNQLIKIHPTKTYGFNFSCNTTPHDIYKPLKTSYAIDRRNLLMGLGGFFGGAHLGTAFAVDNHVQSVNKVEDVELPIRLNKIVRLLVKSPAINRTKEDKKKANEILFVNGIKFDGEKYVKFDVFVNDKDDVTETTAADSEFVGSFVQLPHGKREKMMMSSGRVRFGLTEVLEDIRAEDDEYVLVNLLPRTGCDDVTVSEIKIELV